MAAINLLRNASHTDERRRILNRRIRFFVGATITYNIVEAIIALGAGMGASSSALIGFGLDSIVEVSSAAALAWQFSARDPETREKKALRIIAFSFFALAAFVTADALGSLMTGREADHSSVGIILAAVSLAIMPVLSWAQRRAGRELGSLSAVADSKQTLLCTYLSAVLLIGLLLNSLLGWSWADPIAALVIAGIAVREGLNAWRGDTCCTPLQQKNDKDTEARETIGECCVPSPANEVVGAQGFDCACCQSTTEQSSSVCAAALGTLREACRFRRQRGNGDLTVFWQGLRCQLSMCGVLDKKAHHCFGPDDGENAGSGWNRLKIAGVLGWAAVFSRRAPKGAA